MFYQTLLKGGMTRIPVNKTGKLDFNWLKFYLIGYRFTQLPVNTDSGRADKSKLNYSYWTTVLIQALSWHDAPMTYYSK